MQRLEQLVDTFINNSADPVRTTKLEETVGQLSVDSLRKDPRVAPNHHAREDDEGVSYAGATHWSTILQSIHDLRDCLESSEEISTSTALSPTAEGTSCFFFRFLEPIQLQQALDALPTRSTTNKLLSIYFNTFITAPSLHSGKFHRQNQRFWGEPSTVSFIWLSVLFSTLCLATSVATANGNPIASNVDPVLLMTKAGECLLTGQYYKPQAYAIESLLLYSYCQYTQSADPDPTLWSSFGFVTRLAQRMGYHRDPLRLSDSITPFECEMRRRTWCFVHSFDLLFSFQLGLPALIHEDECDTEPPKNLLDEDFDESTQRLPSARPDTDLTPMLYYCYKAQLIRLLRRILRHVLSTRRTSYEATMQLDRELNNMHNEIPPGLRMKPI